VIGLDPDYGWVLARTPRLDEATMAGIRRILQRNGYHDVRVELSDTRL
jgi:lipocalin